MYIEETLYKQIMETSIIPTVDLLLMYNNQIFLTKRTNNPLKDVYYFPGWRRNKLESLNSAIVRKAKEELDLDIDLSRVQYLNTYDDIFPDSMFEGVQSHCYTVSYIYQLVDHEFDAIHLDSQHSDFKFFDIDNPDLHEMVKVRIKDRVESYIIA